MKIFLLILSISIIGNHNCLYINKRQISALCANLPCQNGGKCIQFGINTAYCACINGFTGATCDIAPPVTTTKNPPTTTTKVSICSNALCKNGGICKEIENSIQNLAICECKNGYTGIFCEIAPTAQTTNFPQSTTITLSKLCSLNLCQNGGTCVDSSSNTASCQCPQGYGGSFCENIIATSNNPTSTSTSTTTSTSTSTSTTTSTSTSTSTTTSTSTSTSTTTSTSTSTSTTTSTSTSTSTTTSTSTSTITTTPNETPTTTLQPKPCPSEYTICQNKGTCLYTDAGSITCNCPLPYNGTFCEIANKFCDLNPCKNGATCEQTEEYDGKCICPPDYKGRTCDTKPCDADKNPCKNDPYNCFQTDDKTICLCRPPFSGDFCEISS